MKSKKRIRSIAWLLCLVLIASLFPLTAQASLSEPTATDVTIAQVESPYYAHFPDIVNVPASVYGGAYPNGKLLVAYYKNVTHAPSSSAQPFGVIQIVESTDNGQTWSEPRDVMTPEKLVELGICTADKQVESRDPNFAILRDGTLLLTFFTRRYGTDGFVKAYIMESTDGGDTWGTPVPIQCNSLDAWYAKRGDIAVFDDDQILIPLYGAPASASGNQTAVNILATRTGPNTWKWEGEYKLADSTSLGRTINEVSLVATATGDTVYALAREPGYVWQSDDRGATWKQIGTEISPSGAIHQPGLKLLPDGSIFATWSISSGPGGRPVYGKRFFPDLGWDATVARLIYQYPNGSCDMADPSSILTNDGKLLVIYYVTGLRQIAGTFSDPSDWEVPELSDTAERAIMFADDFEDDPTGVNYADPYFTSFNRNDTTMTVRVEEEGENQFLRLFSQYTTAYQFAQMYASSILHDDFTVRFDLRFNGDAPTEGDALQEFYLCQQNVNRSGIMFQLRNDQLLIRLGGQDVTEPFTLPEPLKAGSWYSLSFTRIGNTFYVKIWEKGTTEPTGWTTTYTHTGDITPGALRIGYLTSSTSGQSVDIDNFEISKALTISLPETHSIVETMTDQLELTCYPAQSAPPVSWRSSDPSVASVSDTGLITALKPGTTDITATLYGLSATCTLTVTEIPYELTKRGEAWSFFTEDLENAEAGNYAGSAFNVTAGTNRTITVEQEGSNNFLRFTSTYTTGYNMPQIVSKATYAGDYTATFDFRFGSATEAGDGSLQEAYITLLQSAGVYIVHLRDGEILIKDGAAVIQASTSKTHTPGTWYTIRVSRGEDGIYVRTWPKGTEEPDTWDVTYTHAGITATGSFRIAYISSSKTGQTFDVDNLMLSRRSNVTLSASALSGNITDQPVQLSVNFSPDLMETVPAPTVTWRSEDPSVAEVSSDGLVSFVAPGSTNIVATIGNIVRKCPVAVSEKYDIAFNVPSISVEPGADPVQLTVSFTPTPAQTPAITYTSADPSVATVDQNGLVQIVGEGITYIRAATIYGDAICPVVVQEDAPPVIIPPDPDLEPDPEPVLPYDFPFTDVTKDQWFYRDVVAAHKMNLIDGTTDTTFDPYGDMTLAHALTLAARMHSSVTTGRQPTNGDPWYAPYVAYCLENGIIDAQPTAEALNAPVTRAEYASIFAKALPSSMLPAINDIPDDAIPDVKMDDAHADAIYCLYRAGILDGRDDYGRFDPELTITRAEIATILVRMMDKTERVPAPPFLDR